MQISNVFHHGADRNRARADSIAIFSLVFRDFLYRGHRKARSFEWLRKAGSLPLHIFADTTLLLGVISLILSAFVNFEWVSLVDSTILVSKGGGDGVVQASQ